MRIVHTYVRTYIWDVNYHSQSGSWLILSFAVGTNGRESMREEGAKVGQTSSSSSPPTTAADGDVV